MRINAIMQVLLLYIQSVIVADFPSVFSWLLYALHKLQKTQFPAYNNKTQKSHQFFATINVVITCTLSINIIASGNLISPLTC